MENRVLIESLKQLKQERGYTLYELSRQLDVQVSTLARWLRTNRINRIYAKIVCEKLHLDGSGTMNNTG
ncbi:MAG: helix-turn-helix transcriptional regulator [Candidatus Omnitrophica bacterium]|nr:helix-turn-helix transcriptional regulator [Candidatus Omnitrophota bacterium]